MMVPAGKTSVEDHLYSVHGFSSCLRDCEPSVARLAIKEKSRVSLFRCRWRPAMLVRLAGGQGRAFVSSHNHSYMCNELMTMGAIKKHIGRHLNQEEQPNPYAYKCPHCDGVFVERGMHRKQCAKKQHADQSEVQPEPVRTVEM